MDNRTKVRRTLQGPQKVADEYPGRDMTTSSGPFWCVLDDDVVLAVMALLGELDPALEGEAWQQQRRRTTCTVLHLASTCVRLRSVLTGAGHKLHAEMIARAATDVHPGAVASIQPYPYLHQLEVEKVSAMRFKALRYADDQMAFHCAGGCCAEARNSANRKCTKACAGAILSVESRASVRCMGAAVAAPVAFAHVIVPKPFRSHGGGVKPQRDWIRKYVHDEKAGVRIDACIAVPFGDAPGSATLSNGRGTRGPLLMASNHDGTAVAYTLPSDQDYTEQTGGPLVRAWVWRPGEGAPVEAHRPLPCALEGYIGDEPPGYDAPVALWWDEDDQLCVVWSTTVVHPMGHDIKDGETVGKHERYCISHYEWPSDSELYLGVEYEGPFYGRAITASASARGDRVVCLVRTLPTSRRDTLYTAVVHHRGMAVTLKHPQVWKCNGKSSGPEGRDWGPSAAGISPAGDCVVCIHRTLGTVLAEVFDLDDGATYARVNSYALTEWLGCGQGAVQTGANAVKLRFHVGFSPCGRFAVVTDQRARWKYAFTGYATVVVDLAARRSKKATRCQPLSYSDEGLEDVPSSSGTPLRAIEWRDEVTWVLSSSGMLAIRP